MLSRALFLFFLSTILWSRFVFSIPIYDLSHVSENQTLGLSGNSVDGVISVTSYDLSRGTGLLTYGSFTIKLTTGNLASSSINWIPSNTRPDVLCPADVTRATGTSLTPEGTARFRAWVDSYMRSGVSLMPQSPTLPIVNSSNGSVSTIITCRLGYNPLWATIDWATRADWTGRPPVVPSCTLRSDISFDFTSTAPSVTGLSQTKPVSIFCQSTGTATQAASLRLRLISGDVSNGSITFGNGVRAFFDLDSTALLVNGGGITMSLYSSSSPSLTATLVGAATSAGKSYASGVLILDNL